MHMQFNEDTLEFERMDWTCDECGEQNHVLDAECQFCDAHEHYTQWNDYDAAKPDAPQKCSACGVMYGGEA